MVGETLYDLVDCGKSGRGKGCRGMNGNLGVRPGGAVVLERRASGNENQKPRIEGRQQGRPRTEPRPVGSVRRLIHRTSVLSLVVGTVAALIAWVGVLAWGAVWVVHQIPGT